MQLDTGETQVGISINTQELYQILEMTPEKENIMLVGRHGIGKSQILRDFYESKGMKVVALFLGQMSDPGDLIGLPVRDANAERTVFMPPYWFPKDGQPVVLFLDELNRARPEVLQTIMDLALNKTIAGRKLPEGSRIISAVNEGDEYQVTDLDPALVSRFNIYEFKPSMQEWLKWADGKIDERILKFISKNPSFLDDYTASGDASSLEKTADRRGWEKVSHIIENVSEIKLIHQRAISGIIGAKITARFAEFLSENHLVNALDLLLDFDSVKDKITNYKTQEFALLNDSIFRALEKEHKIAENKSTAKMLSENLENYVDFLFEKKANESIAHFVSCMEGDLYNEGTKFIMMYARNVFQKCTDFVMNL